MSKLKKVGELKVISGEYTDKETGKAKNSYRSVAAVFATPHHSRISLKFYATALTDERWANIYWDEGYEPKEAGVVRSERSQDSDDNDEIDF